MDPLTDNRYALTGANPISYVDVDGHAPSWDIAADDGPYGSNLKVAARIYGAWYEHYHCWLPFQIDERCEAIASGWAAIYAVTCEVGE